MPGYLRQATAAQSRALGPFISDTDFKTTQTGLTVANTDIKLIVNGGASANKNSGGGTHRANGVYGVTFDATDTATVGEMEVSVVVSGALPVFDKFFVVEEAVYDALFVASAPGYVVDQPVNVTKVGGTSQTAGDIIGDTNDIQTRLPAALVSGRMDSSVGAMAANTLTATAIAADAITAAKVADGTIDAATFAAGAINAAAIAADAITDAKVAADVTIASVTGAVGSVTGAVGSVTGNVGGNVVGSVASVTARVTANTDQLAGQTVTAAAGVTFPTSVASPTNITAGTITTVTNLTNAPTAGDFTATMKTSIGTAVAASAVASVTGNVGGNVTGSVGSVATGGIAAASFAAGAIDAAAIATDAIDADALKADAVTEIQSGLASQASVDVIDGIVDAILVDTAEIGAAGAGLTALASAANLATVDTVVDAIKVTTDKVDDTLEDDAGVFRFTANALEQAPTGGSAPTAADIADAVWEEAIGDHSGTTGSTAEALGAAGAAGDPWTTLLPGAYGAGSAGKIIGDNIDATISSRLATSGYTAPLDAAGTRTAVGLASANLDTQLDALPTAAENTTAVWAAGTRVLTAGTNIVLAKGTGVTGFNDLSAAQVNAEADTALSDVGVTTTVTGRIDAAISTRASQTSVNTIDDFVDTEVAAIKTVTDKLDTALELDGLVYRYTTNALEQGPTGSGASAADIADAVWDESLAGHAGAGSTGEALSAASAGSDPSAVADAVWDEPIADHQTAGTTGEAILDAGAGGNPWNTPLEGAFTAGEIMRLMAAVMAGKTSIVKLGSHHAEVTFRAIDDSDDRVVSTADHSERTAVTLTP